ncbi:MAG TPA: tetratricopeptide repeat protein, partial [Polyangiaceae bacterium LLY-WYZ-14_1]|nr:tetratricopeptide repeat protein [Polyangiaceae bacterium LLY-WYZ-14_1]
GVPTLASELHADARAARRGGRTAQAIRTYENLLARFPSYLRRGQALLELGDAYRDVGRSADARNAYRRAGRHPGLGATAEGRLARLEDGGARSPATADQADEAGAGAEEAAEGDGSSSSEGEEGEPPEEAD